MWGEMVVQTSELPSPSPAHLNTLRRQGHGFKRFHFPNISSNKHAGACEEAAPRHTAVYQQGDPLKIVFLVT